MSWYWACSGPGVPSILNPALCLQVYSLVVMLPKTPLKERISLPCKQLVGGSGIGLGVGQGSVWTTVTPLLQSPW